MGVNIAGETTANYTISSTTVGDAGTYRCVVSGSDGSITSNDAVLTVIPGTAIAGLIDADTVWGVGGSPYNVTGNMLVKSGVKLTVEAGVEIHFTGAYQLGLDGVLEAVGAETNPILFTGTGWKGLELDTKWFNYSSCEDQRNHGLWHLCVEIGQRCDFAG